MSQTQSDERQVPNGNSAGRVLVVDLQKREWRLETLENDIPARFLGGRGVSAYLLTRYDEFKSMKAAPVVFAPGLLTGVIPFGLTCLTACPAGSFMKAFLLKGLWGAELKMTGYDHLVLVGKSESSIILKICNSRIIFEEAAGLWEKGFSETENLIKGTEGDVDVETLVTYGPEDCFSAGSMHEPVVNGIFREKNIKAITVRGSKGLKIFSPSRFKGILKNILPLFAGQHDRSNRFFTRKEDLSLYTSVGRENTLLPFSPGDRTVILDCLGLEPELAVETLLPLVYSITGRDYCIDELERVVRRIKAAEVGRA